MNGKDRIVALLSGESPDSLPLMPITMMFATDVLGKPYRDYVTDYRILAEAQLCTADAFDLVRQQQAVPSGDCHRFGTVDVVFDGVDGHPIDPRSCWQFPATATYGRIQTRRSVARLRLFDGYRDTRLGDNRANIEMHWTAYPLL